MMRSDGMYWVRDGKNWRVARWNSTQGWWVIAFIEMDDPAYPSAVCTDARFSEIGPRLFSPDDPPACQPGICRPTHRGRR